MRALTQPEIRRMSYVQLLSSIDEVNRPPGGKDSIRRLVQNCFINESSRVLDVGCNTGFCTFEIAHLAKCHVTGVDISPDMIQGANRAKETDPLKNFVSFQVADGMKLPFKNDSFDVVMSGGSTAFIPDKKKALREYQRVTKPWGFIADINFFYKKTPPKALLNQLNSLMEIDIKPWKKNYWMEVYKSCGLETYHVYVNDVYMPRPLEVQTYCQKMADEVRATREARRIIKRRLMTIMTLFAKNHQFLSYGIFILRKRTDPMQPSLFDPEYA